MPETFMKFKLIQKILYTKEGFPINQGCNLKIGSGFWNAAPLTEINHLGKCNKNIFIRTQILVKNFKK